jgi:hypothetical protein
MLTSSSCPQDLYEICESVPSCPRPCLVQVSSVLAMLSLSSIHHANMLCIELSRRSLLGSVLRIQPVKLMIILWRLLGLLALAQLANHWSISVGFLASQPQPSITLALPTTKTTTSAPPTPIVPYYKDKYIPFGTPPSWWSPVLNFQPVIAVLTGSKSPELIMPPPTPSIPPRSITAHFITHHPHPKSMRDTRATSVSSKSSKLGEYVCPY